MCPRLRHISISVISKFFPSFDGGHANEQGVFIISRFAAILSVIFFLCATNTAYGKNMLMPSTKTLTLQQQIHWQTKIIKHDRWVLHTAKVHKPEVVKWHRHQLLWTKRELSESLKLSHRQTSVTSPSWLSNAFLCIHRYEGSWTANTGNGYYGGLQMDYGFMRTYGPEFLKRWGTADTWPVWAQIEASVRAHNSGRGFTPWPNTARACGLL